VITLANDGQPKQIVSSAWSKIKNESAIIGKQSSPAIHQSISIGWLFSTTTIITTTTSPSR